MPRLEPRSPEEVGLATRLAYRYAERRYGRVPDPVATWAHAPAVFWTWSVAETLTEHTWRALPSRIAELAAVRVASVLGCTWCLDFGSLVARFKGVTEERLRAVHDWRASAVFDDDERLVLEYADAMTRTPLTVSDGLVERVRDRFGERGTVELTAMIALENQRSRFNHALGIVSQGFSNDVCAAPAVDREAAADSDPATAPTRS